MGHSPGWSCTTDGCIGSGKPGPLSARARAKVDAGEAEDRSRRHQHGDQHQNPTNDRHRRHAAGWTLRRLFFERLRPTHRVAPSTASVPARAFQVRLTGGQLGERANALDPDLQIGPQGIQQTHGVTVARGIFRLGRLQAPPCLRQQLLVDDRERLARRLQTCRSVVQLVPDGVLSRLERGSLGVDRLFRLAFLVPMAAGEPGQIDADHRAVSLVVRDRRQVPVVEPHHDLRESRRISGAVEERFAATKGAGSGVDLGPIRVDAAFERRDLRRGDDGQILRRSERRLRRPVHESIQQRPARAFLPLDARHVGVQAGHLELQAKDVLQAAMTGALIEAGQLQHARSQTDVLQMEAQLLVGLVVGRVRAPDLCGDLLPSRARHVARAAGLFGRRPTARVERPPRRKGLAHTDHQRLGTAEVVRTRKRNTPLLVFELEIRKP